MAKIALIKCEYINKYHPSIVPPLGLLYIATQLLKNNNYVKIFDMQLNYKNYNSVIKDVLEYKPDIIGISIIYNEFQSFEKIVKLIRKSNKEVVIIAGGPLPTTLPHVFLEYEVDYVVIGEGEYTIIDLVNYLNKKINKSLQDIDGICFKKDNVMYKTELRNPIEDLDKLDFPDWNLIDIDKYKNKARYFLTSYERYLPILTSRGCPFNCVYCYQIFGKKYRARSVSNIIEEIKYLQGKYNVYEYEVWDELFNYTKDRLEEFCDSIILNNLKCIFSFPSSLRCDILSTELLEKLKLIGTRDISISIETVSKRMQRKICRNLNINQINKIINQCHKLDIYTRGYFMLGFPDEKDKEIEDTIKFACKSKLNHALFFIVTPWPDTIISNDYSIDKSNFAINKADYVYKSIDTDNEKMKKLKSYQKKATRKFYLNFKRLFNNLINNPCKIAGIIPRITSLDFIYRIFK